MRNKRKDFKKERKATKMKKSIALLLFLCMLISSGIGTTTTALAIESENVGESEMDSAENRNQYYSLDDRLNIHYQINEQWDGHANVNVTLENVSGEVIDDWEISFRYGSKIEKVWNAEISSHEGDEHIVKNAGWNQDIPVDGTVSFGMIVSYDKEFTYPTEYYLTRECMAVSEDDYAVDYIEESRWDNRVKGKFTITNKGNHVIEDWKLNLDSNLNIESIWNASIISTYETIQCIDNAEKNRNIHVGETVEFGFIASCDAIVEIESYILDEMCRAEKPELDEEGNVLPDAEHIMEPDDFDTIEEMKEYIAQGGYVEGAEYIEEMENEESPLRARAAAKKAKKTDAKVRYKLKHEKSDAAAIQGFYQKGGICYTMTRNENNAILRQNILTPQTNIFPIKEAGKIKMEGFAHGQTIDQFTVKKGNAATNYFLLGGKADKGWSTELACIDYATIVKYKAKEDEFSYKDNLTKFKQIKDLAYANADRKKSGTLNRADAALSADGTNLVIWAKFKGNNIQVSVYNFTKIKNYLYGLGGEKAHQTFSFKTNKSVAQKAFYASYIKSAEKEEVLKPSDSFQSIEVSNTITSNNKKAWHIYTCGGNESKYQILKIGRFLIRKGEKKIAGQKLLPIKPLIPAEDKNTEKEWEIEGCHINGDYLDFSITACAKGKKRTQYIHYIKKSEF